MKTRLFVLCLLCLLCGTGMHAQLLLKGKASYYHDALHGNKVTLDMGASNPAWRTVEMYMFQDKDDTQLHMFMSTRSCINYLANFAIPALIEEGKLDPTDAAAVEKVFTDMEARVESINVSFVLKARK